MRKVLGFGLLSAALLAAGGAMAAGDLAIRPIELETLEVAGGEYGFSVSHDTIELETGQSYRLTIYSPGKQECGWRAPQFVENIYIRKIEVGSVEIKVRAFDELEFEEEGEAELFFVPVRPGTFEWYCRGLEPRGVMGNFVVR